MEFCTWDQTTLSKSGEKTRFHSKLSDFITNFCSEINSKTKAEMTLEENNECAQNVFISINFHLLVKVANFKSS